MGGNVGEREGKRRRGGEGLDRERERIKLKQYQQIHDVAEVHTCTTFVMTSSTLSDFGLTVSVALVT